MDTRAERRAYEEDQHIKLEYMVFAGAERTLLQEAHKEQSRWGQIL
jgi:hypothetical protein